MTFCVKILHCLTGINSYCSISLLLLTQAQLSLTSSLSVYVQSNQHCDLSVASPVVLSWTHASVFDCVNVVNWLTAMVAEFLRVLKCWQTQERDVNISGLRKINHTVLQLKILPIWTWSGNILDRRNMSFNWELIKFYHILAITRLWRFVATAFRKKVCLIISTKSNRAVCVLIIFLNM